jgi:hypothetical protein
VFTWEGLIQALVERIVGERPSSVEPTRPSAPH